MPGYNTTAAEIKNKKRHRENVAPVVKISVGATFSSHDFYLVIA